MTACLIDSGNTRLKWAWLRADALQDIQTYRHGEDAWRALAADLRKQPAAQLYLSNVAGEAISKKLQQLCTELALAPPHLLQADERFAGLHSAYAKPTQLGIDRWLAMLAAHSLYPQGFVLVDAGSALTIDRVDAQGQHQGGLIVPGFDAMLAGLSTVTRLNCDAIATPRGLALTNNTQSAIGSGCATALVGTIKECVCADDKLLITGGDAHWLLPLLHAAGLTHAEQALHLVLKGLALRINSA